MIQTVFMESETEIVILRSKRAQIHEWGPHTAMLAVKLSIKIAIAARRLWQMKGIKIVQ